MGLSDRFSDALTRIGLQKLEHPVFYHAPVGLRFEIGPPEKLIWEQTRTGERRVAPNYLSAAFQRAARLFQALPAPPDLLRWDFFPGEKTEPEALGQFCRLTGLPRPHQRIEDTSEDCLEIQFYWVLSTLPNVSEQLLTEIIQADFGGFQELVSAVYWMDTWNAVLFHLYDDRGLDLAAADRETLRPVYEAFESWLLPYDRPRIDGVFRL